MVEGERTVVSAAALRASGSPPVGIVSSFPPRRCGIASFAADLAAAMRRAAPDARIGVVAVDPGWETFDRRPPYPAEVDGVFGLVTEAREGYREAARWLEDRGCQVVSLQHEYGLFGGEHGRFILELVRSLRVPVVTTLHTVLRRPDPLQREILAELAARSQRVVVQARSAVELLRRVYGVNPARVVVIPHGTPPFTPQDPMLARLALGFGERPVLLTYGLLSPGKGIEQAIQALAAVARRYPDVLYVVAGQTHPNVRVRMGEAYRFELMELARTLGVAGNLHFIDRYLEVEELTQLLAAADVYITPYPNEEQVVSGTLTYALSAGKAVVSTPFRYAREVLGPGRGLLCRFGDPISMAREILRLLDEPDLRRTLERRARAFGQWLSWDIVGVRYGQLLREAAVGSRADRPPAAAVEAGGTASALRRACIS